MTLNQLKYAVVLADEASFTRAARRLFISQPTLSLAIRELEDEIGIELFRRSVHGVLLTPDGEEFISYARHINELSGLIQAKYIDKAMVKKKFSVSTQHYSFAVSAFVELVKQFGMEEYEFAIHETRTYDVIEHVKNFKSEIGILYMNDLNQEILQKVLREAGVEFHEILSCGVYAYLRKGHPLAGRSEVTLEELDEYPCLIFEQGEHNSYHFAEEVLSTYEYKQIIRADDRATMLNLMLGLDGFTLCSGIICDDLNGGNYCVVRLKSDTVMRIGYIARTGVEISPMGKKYLHEIAKFQNKGLK